MMNHLKLSCSLLLRYALCVLLSLLLFLSFGAVFTPLCTEIIGYDVYLQDAETGALEKAYTHFYADGEDEKLARLKEQNVKYQVANLRSEMEGAAATAVFAAAQSLCFAMFLALVPRRLYVLGQNDFQNGNLHNPLTVAGLGATASAAQMLTFLLLVLAKTGTLSASALMVFRMANYPFYGLLRLILGTENDLISISWGRIWLAVLPGLISAVSCFAAYQMGKNNVHPLSYLMNRIRYKED